MKLSRILGLSLIAIGLNSLMFFTNAIENSNHIDERISYISSCCKQKDEKNIKEKADLLSKHAIDAKYDYIYYTLFPNTPEKCLDKVKKIFEQDIEKDRLGDNNLRMIYSFLYVNLYKEEYEGLVNDLIPKANLLLGILIDHGHVYAKAYSDAIIMGLSEEEASVRASIYKEMVAKGEKSEDYIKEYSVIVAREGNFKKADACATEYEKRLKEMGQKEAKITARCNFNHITDKKSLEVVKEAILKRSYDEVNINRLIKIRLKGRLYKWSKIKKDMIKKKSKEEIPPDIKRRVLNAIDYNQALREYPEFPEGEIAIEYARCKKMGRSDRYSLAYAYKIVKNHSIEEADIRAKREEKE